MQKKEAKAEESKHSHKHNWVHFLVVLIIATVILLIFKNGFSSATGSAVSSRQKSLPDLKPLVFDAELVSYGEYQSEDTFFYVSVANIGNAKAIKPIVRVREDWYGDRQGSHWADYELSPIPPNGGTTTVQSYIGENLGFTYRKYYLSATADPSLKIRESNEENNYLGGYVIINCTSASPDPVYGFNCCMTFEGTAWKRSGTVCY